MHAEKRLTSRWLVVRAAVFQRPSIRLSSNNEKYAGKVVDHFQAMVKF